jgi:hypothetical protein
MSIPKQVVGNLIHSFIDDINWQSFQFLLFLTLCVVFHINPVIEDRINNTGSNFQGGKHNQNEKPDLSLN